jgi:retron-type reverse transcriptase
MEFSTNLIKFISSFLSQRKFRVSVEGEMSTPGDIKAGVPQGSVLSPTLCNLYINDTPQTNGANLAFSADDTSLYATECKKGYALIKLQRVPNSMAAWFKHWNIKIN